ncbi:hypothetical protein KAT24_01675 [Candidatus Pacearchaeota archaeon]|nr:hypothetical protein [Candidatus Pacearchaeota archaeon]
MSWKNKEKKDNISEEEWKIVEERLKTMPNKMRLGILSNSYTKQELLLQVQDRTEIGKAYVQMQVEFIKWLAKQSKISQGNQ